MLTFISLIQLFFTHFEAFAHTFESGPNPEIPLKSDLFHQLLSDAYSLPGNLPPFLAPLKSCANATFAKIYMGSLRRLSQRFENQRTAGVRGFTQPTIITAEPLGHTQAGARGFE